jgi:hypothetical protein
MISPSRDLSTDPSAVEKPLRFNCPKCGQPLSVHGSRLRTDADGQPERVHIYFCLTDGFFSLNRKRGLVDGL